MFRLTKYKKTKTQRKARCEGLKAFTLLELLLVIAIIAVLAGIIMFALKPADRLREANQTKYLSNAKDIEKAISTYIVDNRGNLPGSFSNLTYGYYDICKQGQSGECVNLDTLVPLYLPTVPYDTENATATTTGFKVKYDPSKKEAIVYSNSEYTSRIESGTTLTEGLVGWWKMDESSWNGTTGEVKDSSGNVYDGKSVNGAIPSSGKINNSGSFDGINDRVDLPDNSKFDFTNTDFTVSSWFNLAAYYSAGTICKQSPIIANDDYGWKVIISQTGVISFGYYYIPSASTGINAISTIGLNTWYHVVGVFSKSTNRLSIFINGELENEKTISNTNIYYSGSDSPHIGAITDCGGQNNLFQGKIDDSRIYNRALNSDEILSLYNWSPTVTSDTLMSWSLNENSGNVVNDSSGNNYVSTIFNNPTWTTGKYGSGLNFDGNDIVGFSFAQTLPEMTISAWVNPTSYGSWRAIVQTANSGDRALYLKNSNLQFYPACISLGTVPLNDWTYVTVTVDSNDFVTYYINGVASGSCTSITNPRVIEYINISGINTTDGENWVGKIDEVKIYNYVRTPAEIIEDMNS